MDTIIGALMKQVITSFARFADNEIARVLGVEDEIRNMRGSLERITRELSRPDWTTIIVHSEAISKPLKDLTDIAYEAENVIDRFKIKTSILHTSQLQEWSGSPMCRSCKELELRHDTAKRIEELNQRLEGMMASSELVRDLEALAARNRNDSARRESLPAPGCVEHNLIGSVISRDCMDRTNGLRRGRNQVLLAIVGAPGVGKTALARKIYRELRGQFPARTWVHVSSCTGKLTIWSGDTMETDAPHLETAQKRETIRERLMNGPRSLLVVDNLWDMEGWDFLLRELGAFIHRGVRVVVTTPNWDVATRLKGVRDTWSCYHRVSALDEDDGLQLLWRTAQLRDHDVATFQDVGRRIVRKCSGIPLALEAVGYKLRSMGQVGHWEKELSSDFIVTYNEIRKSIGASYMILDNRLKRCFLYCSLYTEGSVIEERYIVQQWIAEGIFQGAQQSDPEEEARKCYTELVNRSLLLPTTTDGSCATMPALLRSYAVYQSQDENHVGAGLNIGGGEFKVWRLCATDVDTIRDIPEDVTSLRTLVVSGSSGSADGVTESQQTGRTGTIPSAVSVICRKFTSLRVLDLRDTQVESVSRRIGSLLQLRYLNLSGTSIRKLPRQVGKLVMLQFFILKNCLHLESLPSGIGRLRQLRCLDISGTPELQEVRFRLFHLTELNSFQGFLPVSSAFTGSSSSSRGWTFTELNQLSMLTSLQILKIGSKTTSSQEAKQLCLDQKTNLKELELCGQPSEGEEAAETESIRGVLTALEPPQSLVSLKLANVLDTELPRWMTSQFTALQRLTLEGCSRCQQLPALGGMEQLKFLAIAGFSALSEINHVLRGVETQTVAFPGLEQLTVSEMNNLQTWCGLEPRDMPKLGRLQLSDCPKLTKLPTWLQHCTALASLEIQGAGELMQIRDLHALKTLQVGTCRALKSISNLGLLEDLTINGCSNLNAVEGVPSVRCLLLHEHAAELPPWLQERRRQRPFPLRRLEIVGSEVLLDNYSSELAPHWPVIRDAADHVYAKLQDGSIYFYAKGTGGHLYRSPRCIQRANTRGPVLERGDRKAWMSRSLLSTLFAALLFCWGFAVHYSVFM